jgi:NADH:ubiquinone oxidoreductase subunit 6 (subunit J)
MLKLIIKFNAEGSRVIIVVVHVGALKLYLAAVEAALRKEERQDETQFTTKILVGKLVWVPVILLCKIFIPS